MLQVSNSVRDSIKPDVTLFVGYRQDNIDGKTVIKVAVQRGTSCPYYLAGKGIRPEGVYVRQGASTVPATETAILRMIKETDGEKYEDVRSLNQTLTFSETENEFKKQSIPFGAAQQKTLGLMNVGGIYTNLGLLLSDQCVHTVKIAVFEGAIKAVFKDRREFTGSLLRQLNDIYEFIDRYNRNRSEIAGLYRTDKRDYPAQYK
jgi:ATP-dependent DNA helicase RecG